MGDTSGYDEAMNWFLSGKWWGVLVLRASGSDWYNNYKYIQKLEKT